MTVTVPNDKETTLDKITSRTTIANIVAGVGFVGAIIYGIIARDPNVITNAGFLGAGYLFGVTTAPSDQGVKTA